MSMTEWARREVEIACKRERGDKPEDEWDYGCACYESALKAYECLAADGHSGMSWGITAGVIKRLIAGKPLTPIEDVDEVWGDGDRFGRINENCTSYQCKRMSSLFKEVYDDGRVIYSDINRVVCVDVDSPNSCWTNGFITELIDEMFPITMPYMPSEKPYKVYMSDCLSDRKNGDFDTMAVWKVVTPDGDEVEINRYFKTDRSDWVEIDLFEWGERLIAHNERVEDESKPKYNYCPEEKELNTENEEVKSE